ncbi:MAG: hypothetical protein R2932_29910 [Caldilineaceae bacterium]
MIDCRLAVIADIFGRNPDCLQRLNAVIVGVAVGPDEELFNVARGTVTIRNIEIVEIDGWIERIL